jgi:hypothetical protein
MELVAWDEFGGKSLYKAIPSAQQGSITGSYYIQGQKKESISILNILKSRPPAFRITTR